MVACLVAARCPGDSSSDSSGEAAAVRASELLVQGKPDDAVELLRPLVTTRPSDLGLQLLYGRALLQNQQASLAIWPLERVVTAPDPPTEAQALFVRALAFGGAANEAIREATTVLEASPDDAEVRRLRADAYRNALRLAEALADYDRLIGQLPADPVLLETKIRVLTELDRPDEARRAIEALREMTQGDDVLPLVAAQFCASAARFDHERGASAQALEALDDCLARFPGDPGVILTRVDVLDDAEREAEATEFLVEQSRSEPARFRIQYTLATRLAGLDRMDEAEQVLQEAAKHVKGSQPFLALADLRVARRDLVGAAQSVEDGIASELGRRPGDPDFDWTAIPAEGLFAFGDVFISAEQYDRAREIIEVVDEEVYSLLLRARLALATGDDRGALDLYERAFRLWPSNPGARYLAGVAAMRIGEFDRALGLYQDAFRSDPQATDAGIVLARIQRAQGLAGAAFDTLDIYLRKSPDHPQALREFASAAMQAGLFEYAEAARARLASDLDWAGIAIADHTRDVWRARGAEQALAYLEGAEERFASSHFEALSLWVELKSALAQHDRAAAKVEALYRSDPEAPGFAIVWARLLGAQLDWDEARAVLEPVAAAHPSDVVVQRELGKILRSQREFDAAIERFDHADRLEPLDAEAAYLACQTLEEAGRSDDARERLDRFVRRHPWHADALIDLARLRVAEDQPKEASLVFASQAARLPESATPVALATLGLVFADLDRKEEAIASLRLSDARNGVTPRDRRRLAELLIEVGRIDEARIELEANVAGLSTLEQRAARELLSKLDAQPRPSDAGGKTP